MGEKKLAEAYILGIPFGLFGAHNFYLGRKKFGILYLCTLGLFGLGYLFDLVRMRWLVKHANKHGADSKMISDCYLIGFLGGIFGAHHFYLGNKKLGVFYLCTLGVFTMGWLVDLVRMKQLVKDSNSKREEKSLGTAYILSFPPFGIFGAHHYYLGNMRLGLIYTFTFGIFCLGWIMDLFRMKTLVRKAGQDKNSVGTALIMAMPPFGLFGAHHYYLGNYFLGIVYTFTFGIFTIGWIVDLFRMKDLVKASNDPSSDYGTTKVTAYVLCVSPLGIFGAHHFYLQRYFNGGFYVATLGLFGFGWIFDILRLPVLYERYADEDKHKYPDEAYIFWFPFGLFGLHHFYLGNKKWGILYACTFGCLGIGWIIDGIRLPSMIKDFNKYVEDPDMNDFRICRPSCRSCSINRCRRGCFKLFSCPCFTNFSLASSSSSVKIDENGTTANTTKPRDDFDVIKEMYPDENPDLENQTLTQNNGVEIYTIGQSQGANKPAYDNGAHPGDPGYDEPEFQEVCGISEDENVNEAGSYPDQVNDNNTNSDNYPTENYPRVGSYHDNEYHDENYQHETYADDNNYHDNEQYTDEIRHHGDVNVTVQDGVEHYADDWDQHYNEQYDADGTRHYDDVTNSTVQYEMENRINDNQVYNTNNPNDGNTQNVHL